VGCPLWRENWYIVYSAVTHWSKSRRTHILTTPESREPGPSIYISQEQGGPVISPGSLIPKWKSKLSYDRRSVGQSVLVSGHHHGPWPIFLFLEIFLTQLWVYYFVTCSLARDRVCNLLLQSLSGLSPAGLKTIFYCPNFWDSLNLKGQAPVFMFHRNRVAQLYPRALGSLIVASYDLHGNGGGILTRLHTDKSHPKTKLHYIESLRPTGT
jgi:hypothetical protein